MTENKPSQPSGPAGQLSGMPDAFVAQVRELLAHLYDLPYLQELAIVKERAAAQVRPLRSTALTIKQEVMELLEALNPGRDFYFRAPEARAYHILLLHYVERHTVQNTADELGISERQAYRELRQAEADLALLFWRRHQERAFSAAVHDSMAQHVQADAVGAADLSDLLTSVVDVVRPLAAVSSVPIGVILPERSISLLLNLPVARQVLINLLSRAIQSAVDGVMILATNDSLQLKITIQYTLRSEAPDSAPQPDAVILPMIERLGWGMRWDDRGGVILDLPAPLRQKSILCIDDDASFSELLRRYLTGFPVQVLSATNGQQGIDQAIHA
ncbi:MAG: hypothetical protein R6W76_07765, partial [Caldilinea sp.]